MTPGFSIEPETLECDPIDPDPGDRTQALRARMRLDGVVGQSVALAHTLRRVRAASALGRLPVLLTGETGTGKSHFARVLHDNSPRREGPFVAVNCAAIPPHLWEVEFFGSSRNAYTQAVERGGRFSAAAGGTLLLDEIGEIPLERQAALLRVLDEGCYERLGEDCTRRADVRIVAATHRDLAAAARAREFRSDLLFRIDRFRIELPALRERIEDVPELARVLLERACKRMELPPITIAFETLEALATLPWPGNIRQLESAIVQALAEVLVSGGHEILPEHLRSARPACADGDPERVLDGPAPELPLREAVHRFKRTYVLRALRTEHGDVARAAQRLGLARTHLYAVMRSLDIPTSASAPRPTRGSP